jgi:NTE family protein
MNRLPALGPLLLALLLGLAGCQSATRQVNPALKQIDQSQAHGIGRQGQSGAQRDTLVVLAFSGGGTRAAAFSYGVLEALKRTEIQTQSGQTVRLLDRIDIITGVSGGSFTALAYRLYGDKLFDEYEKRFLKRNVQGDITGRTLNPANWPALSSPGWGRSELAADLYDEILFGGATFGDFRRSEGPFVAVSATDITSGSRLTFTPQNFDYLCADLDSFRIARAAAASSAVPVVLSPLTINNYGGSCGFKAPAWTRLFMNSDDPPRPASRVLNRLHELQAVADGTRAPYLHLVDGGVSDNLGLRSVLDVLTLFEALHEAGVPTPLDHVKRIVVFVVNSLSTPALDWSRSENAPGPVAVLLKSSGVPIDRYSGEQVEQLKDIAARWQLFRRVRDAARFSNPGDPVAQLTKNAPDAALYAIDVSFAALGDEAERAYLNELPTSFVLEHQAVDRLRAAAGKIIVDSPDFQRLLRDVGAKIVEAPKPAP